MRLWSGWWRLSMAFSWAIMLGIFVPLAVTGQAVMALGMLLLFAVIGCLASIWQQLEITETTVKARQGRYGTKQAPRSEVRAIHYLPRVISFRGPDDEPMMMVKPLWTRRQMLKVARELNVPLYNHMRWLGLRTAQDGRLEFDPAAHRAPYAGPAFPPHGDQEAVFGGSPQAGRPDRPPWDLP